jgi:hypothetical protein
MEVVKMEIFFADDSGQRDCRRTGVGPLISVGGVLIDEMQIRPLAAAIDSVTAKFGIPDTEELKWHPPKGSWIHQNLQDGRTDCYRRVLEAAQAHAAKAIVVCWDLRRAHLDDHQAFEECLDYLIERLNMNLENRDSRAIVVADRPGGGKVQEDKFLSYFRTRMEKGTDYVLPDRVLLNALTTPSHLVRHLQLADLVTAITTAMVAGNDKHAGPLFQSVIPLFIKNRPGGIAATGLKISPDSTRRDSLVNLYHWVLGERLLHKGGGAVSYPIPVAGFPFATDGFRSD